MVISQEPHSWIFDETTIKIDFVLEIEKGAANATPVNNGALHNKLI